MSPETHNESLEDFVFIDGAKLSPDGKYYIYYSFDWSGIIGIAKSDSPVGPFKYYGNVSFKNGDISVTSQRKFLPCGAYDLCLSLHFPQFFFLSKRIA